MRVCYLTRPYHRRQSQSSPKAAGRSSTNFGQVSQALGHHPIFSALPSTALEELAKGTKLHDYAPGQLIIRESDPGDSFYLIARGSANVLIGGISGLESVVARLNPGDSFGEAALVSGEKRNATVQAIGDCSCFRINSQVFREALQASGLEPEFVTPMLRSSSALRRSSVFKDMSPSSLRDLFNSAERKTWAKGTTLMREGDPGSQFYIVESGKLEVSQSGSIVGEIGPGDCVGELALLNDAPALRLSPSRTMQSYYRSIGNSSGKLCFPTFVQALSLSNSLAGGQHHDWRFTIEITSRGCRRHRCRWRPKSSWTWRRPLSVQRSV